MFIGYSRIRKAYQIYDPETNSVVESQTVKFDESRKGSKLLSTERTKRQSHLSLLIDEKLAMDKNKRNTGQTLIDNVEIDVIKHDNSNQNSVSQEMENRTRGRPRGNHKSGVECEMG